MATAVHGVLSYMGPTGVTDYGYIQSFSVNNSAEKSEAKDNLGNTADVEYYEEKLEATMTVIPDNAISIPSIGDVVAVTHRQNAAWSGNYIIDSLSMSEGQSDRPTLEITATRYTTNGIPT